jgi:hypothetical protein
MFKSGQRSASQAQWSRLQHWVTSADQFEDDHVRLTTDRVNFGASAESALWTKCGSTAVADLGFLL